MEDFAKEIRHEAALKLRQKFIDLLTDTTSQLLEQWKQFPQTTKLEECKRHLTDWTLHLISGISDNDEGMTEQAGSSWKDLEHYAEYFDDVFRAIQWVNRRETREIIAGISHPHSYDI